MALLPLKEIALDSGYSVPTIRRWVKCGRLPAVQIGRAYRVDLDEYRRVLAESRVPVPSRDEEEVAV